MNLLCVLTQWSMLADLICEIIQTNPNGFWLYYIFGHSGHYLWHIQQWAKMMHILEFKWLLSSGCGCGHLRMYYQRTFFFLLWWLALKNFWTKDFIKIEKSAVVKTQECWLWCGILLNAFKSESDMNLLIILPSYIKGWASRSLWKP